MTRYAEEVVVPERSKPQTHNQTRHDFKAALHTARITLRALRPKVTSQDDLDLLDGFSLTESSGL